MRPDGTVRPGLGGPGGGWARGAVRRPGIGPEHCETGSDVAGSGRRPSLCGPAHVCFSRGRTGTLYDTKKAKLEFGVLGAIRSTRKAQWAPRQAVIQPNSQLQCSASRFHTAHSLEEIRDCVCKFRGTMLGFEKQPQFCLRVGGLEGSFYEGQKELREYCEALYLPQPTSMEVVGTVDDVPCLATGQQLVILVAEGGEVYAYEEETLHKVAKSMQEFMEIGLQHLGKEVYHCGERIESLVSWREWVKAKERYSLTAAGCLGLLRTDPTAPIPNCSWAALPTG